MGEKNRYPSHNITKINYQYIKILSVKAKTFVRHQDEKDFLNTIERSQLQQKILTHLCSNFNKSKFHHGDTLKTNTHMGEDIVTYISDTG